MIHRAYKPSPPLSNFVELFWLYDGYTQPHKKERLLPMGTTEVVFDLREDCNQSWQAVISGPHSQYFEIETSAQFSVIGIHFKPGGAFPFFKMPADELHNQNLPLETLWGSRATTVRDRLMETKTPDARLRVLEECLLAKLTKPLVHNPAVTFALKELHTVPIVRTISDLTDEIGLSARRFIRLFSGEVGLTPKLYCRIRRFQQVLSTIHKKSEIDWADVAINCGYFDQAHFIHDFKAFSGINPSTYTVARTDHLNHVPVLD
jgi:AraC-like DNA-binding protein